MVARRCKLQQMLLKSATPKLNDFLRMKMFSEDRLQGKQRPEERIFFMAIELMLSNRERFCL